MIPERIQMLIAAVLRAEGRLNVEIAKILGVRNAAVGNLLRRAKVEGLFQESARFVPRGVTRLEMLRVMSYVSAPKIEGAINLFVRRVRPQGPDPLVPQVRVFPSATDGCSEDDWSQRLENFSRAGALWVRELLARARICATAWGDTPARMIRAMRDLHGVPPCEAQPVTVIPLSGEPLGSMPTSFSASSLAEEIALLLNGDALRALSIGMVPAFLPGDLTDAELEVVRKLIGYVSAYTRIFGRRHAGGAATSASDAQEAPLIDQVDTVLTSLSSSDRPLGFGMGRLFLSTHLTPEELGEMVVGDIAGVCLPRAGFEARPPRLAAMEQRWTGVEHEHLASCARRAAQAGRTCADAPAGVIVLAVGAAKAECALEAIRAGLVNHLVIDQEMEAALSRAIGRVLGGKGA